MRASGTLVDDHSLRPLSGRAELLLVIDERWSTVEQMQGGVAGFGKQLLSDLSAALGVRKDRLQLTSLSPEEQGRRAAAQLLVFPSREGSPPSALEVAAAACAQASDRGSALRSMPSTRRTAVANFREVRPDSAGGALTPRGLAGRSLGSLALVDSQERGRTASGSTLRRAPAAPCARARTEPLAATRAARACRAGCGRSWRLSPSCSQFSLCRRCSATPSRCPTCRARAAPLLQRRGR